MGVTFLHAADLHLDSPLTNLEPYEGAPIDQIQEATRAAFDNLVEVALSQGVDLVLLAGDLFDGDWHDHQTGLFFVSRVARLTDAGVEVVVARGNHDAASRITRTLRWSSRVHELPTDAAATLRFERLGIAVHGQGYATPAVADDLAAAYPDPVPGWLNIGLLHTALDDASRHPGSAPTELQVLLDKGYDYWALGHAHRRQVLHREPWVVYAGNLQGRRIEESGPKGCTKVIADGGRIQSVEPVALDVLRWLEVRVDVTGLTEPSEVLEQIEAHLATAAEASDGRLVVARVIVEGHVDWAVEVALRVNDPGFVKRVRSTQIASTGRVWVEGVRVEAPPLIDFSELAERDDPLGDLLRWMREIDDAQAAEILTEVQDLAEVLPPQLVRGSWLAKLGDVDVLRAKLPHIERMLLPEVVGSEGDT